MDVRILKYNNYYNRIVKYEKTMDGYMKYVIAAIFNANFKPGDGVTTQFIFNYDSALTDKGGDYMIVTSPDESEISRWFIIDATRLLNGQYKLTLRRDLIVDNLNILLDAPCFIEKATLDSSNPLIFNKENMTFNQIKTSETLLKDAAGCGWIVGYTAKGATMESQTVTTRSLSFYDTVENLENYYNSVKGLDGLVRLGNYDVTWIFKDSNENTFRIGAVNNCVPVNNANLTILNNLNVTNELINVTKSSYNLGSNVTTLLKYDGKIVKDANNHYFKVNIKNEANIYNTTAEGSVRLEMQNIATAAGLSGDIIYKVSIDSNVYSYSLTAVTEQSFKFQIDEHYDLVDAPYGMFAIPYGPITINLLGETAFQTSREIGLATAARISEQWGGASAKLYDLQLLPYFPMQNLIAADGSITLTDSKNFSKITTTDTTNFNNIGVIIWCNSSTMEFSIPYSITVTDPKITNECDMWRLSSPNYNGQFEFNAAKNGGVSYFNVDCEYKPYAPHIHVAPNFNLLYGQDFDDGRGLICAGDFSLTQTSDAFATYQRQNANYDNIFNRQIQNMELNNNINNISNIIGGLTGTAAAAVTGSVIGGPGGAIAGGVMGAVGGIVDYAAQKGLQVEALDYTKDLHGYQLKNIQALPNSITKISSLSPDFKVFPILEYYTCTETEKEALRNKLKYNGMTVMTIGTIREYLRPTESYIKGKIIRIDNLHDEDFHYVNEIAAEVNKGIFIGGTT